MLGCGIILTSEKLIKKLKKLFFFERRRQRGTILKCLWERFVLFDLLFSFVLIKWHSALSGKGHQPVQSDSVTVKTPRGVVFSSRRVCSQRENGRAKFALRGKKTFRLIIHVRGGGGVGVKKNKKIAHSVHKKALRVVSWRSQKRSPGVYNLFTSESLNALKGTARVPTASETWKGDVTAVPEASPLASLSPATTSEVYLSSCLSSQRLLNPAMEHRHV